MEDSFYFRHCIVHRQPSSRFGHAFDGSAFYVHLRKICTVNNRVIGRRMPNQRRNGLFKFSFSILFLLHIIHHLHLVLWL